MPYTVYLSSTLDDLEAERRAVLEALSDECAVKQSYTASTEALVKSCLADVAACDLYIGIIGLRYGYVPASKLCNPKRLSMTELEYRQAVTKNRPRLIFLKDKDAITFDKTDAAADENKMERVRDFRKRASGGDDQRPAEFRTVDQLKLAVVKAFNEWKKTRSDPGAQAPRQDARNTKPKEGTMEDDACEKLISDTLLADLSGEDGADLAPKLVAEIGKLTGLSGEGLFNAVRFFVEYQLLTSEELPSPASLERLLAPARGPDAHNSLAIRLKQAGKTGDFGATPVEVNSSFFSRTREREELWKAYFDSVVENGALPRETVLSTGSIRVRMGFLAAQFLIAGLLSQFDDDWRPLLNAYQKAIPDPKQRRGAYESLQASQWNCWLMWGPSIPVCRCGQWKGLFAFQYGYGDENNSIPLIELTVGKDGLPETLGPIGNILRGERRGARFTQITGRMRWGPWFLREQRPDEEFDLAAQDKLAVEKLGAAPALASLYKDRGPAQRDDRDGIVLQLKNVDDSKPEGRVYFSAYLWLIFLVAVPPKGEPAAKTGPGMLRGKDYPEWPEREEQRVRVREARLWQDLLPVFVHANIGDSDALRFQKQVLVQSALHFMRQLWDRREELFDPDDVKAGIQFHLVCASDYSGCGHEIRFPPEHSLLRELRERLALEGDRNFAGAVMLPAPDENEQTRPWGLAGYFSACHLPELVADYYEHVAKAG